MNEPVDEILNEVLDAHRAILSSDSLGTAVNHAFEKVGRATRADRVYFFGVATGVNGEYRASIEYEWVAPGIAPQIHMSELQDINLRESGYTRWVESFLSYEPIYGTIADFPESERPLLEAQAIKTLLILPVFFAGEFRGFVGFDDCTRDRQWTEAELDVLFALAVTLGQAIGDRRNTRADRSAAHSVSLVATLLKAQTTMLADTPMELLVARARRRLRVVVEAHRYFAVQGAEETVDIRDLLAELSNCFSAIREAHSVETAGRHLSIDAEPIHLKICNALTLVMIVAEVMAVVDHRERPDAAAHVSVVLRRKDGAAHLAITAGDVSGIPTGNAAVLDSIALLMIRQLVDSLDATQNLTKLEGIVYRLSFPIRE